MCFYGNSLTSNISMVSSPPVSTQIVWTEIKQTKMVQRPTQIVSAETLSSQKVFEHKFTRSQGRTQQQGLHRRARPATTRLEWRSSLNIRKWLIQRKRLQQAFIQSRTYQLKSLEGAEGHVRLHNMWDILTISPSILQYWQD